MVSRSMTAAAVMVLLSGITLMLPAQRPTISPPDVVGTVAEGRLLAIAMSRVHPTCSSSVPARASTGVAVAQIYLAGDGSVMGVDVVQAPSEDIAQAVTTAVMAWRFRASPEDAAVRHVKSGKLTFYFARDDARCQVFDSSEAPEYPGWPSRLIPVAREASRSLHLREER
jgi:hypothetical protein